MATHSTYEYHESDDSIEVVFAGTVLRPALLGVVGSKAYGLDHATSDTDMCGIYVAATEEVLGLGQVTDCFDAVGAERDVKLYEIGKAMRLLLAANPSMIELLFLGSYEQLDEDGESLVSQREIFLGSEQVRGAYGGYVLAQAKRLVARGGSFSSDTANRTAKHARHCLRLLEQGRQLLTTGTLAVRVSDPAGLVVRAETALSDSQAFYEEVEHAVHALDDLETVLPEHADRGKANELLVSIRRRQLR